MNIVYFIGNGFDLSLGLRTKYEHFYEYLEAIDDDSYPALEEMKKSIQKDGECWSDLELGMGNHAQNFETEEDAKEFHKALRYALSGYLKKIEENYQCDDSQKDVLSDHLAKPYKHFLGADKTALLKIYNNRLSTSPSVNISVLTLNYTQTFERLIGYSKPNLNIGKTNGGKGISVTNITHIHGLVESNMVIALNDISQFKNETLKSSRYIKRLYVKSETNRCAKLEHEELCFSNISKANIICIFGVSYGDTDSRWWAYIGDQLKRNDVTILLFEYNDKLSFLGLDAVERAEEEEMIKDRFLSKTKLSGSDKGNDTIRNKIFVSMNSKMFGIDKSKFKNKSASELVIKKQNGRITLDFSTKK